jgi:hypothetical protein
MGQSVRPREGSSILNVAHTPGRLDRYVQPADPLVAYDGSGADCAFDIQNNAVPCGAAAPQTPRLVLGGSLPRPSPAVGLPPPKPPLYFGGLRYAIVNSGSEIGLPGRISIGFYLDKHQNGPVRPAPGRVFDLKCRTHTRTVGQICPACGSFSCLQWVRCGLRIRYSK